MIKITSKEEKQNYFDSVIDKYGAYFNVKYTSGEIEFIWVTKYADWDEDGNWYLEAPNQLHRYDFEESYLERYYDEDENEWYDSPYLHMYIVDDKAYEIDSPQTSPFLPKEFEIEFITSDCKEAAKYMLENNLE